MKVYEALAVAFIAEQTTDVFGMMGDANMHWMTALAERGVNLYEVRHEGSGLGMADGWSRTAGRPGVVTTTSGPGVAQLATSMIVASRARTPLVAFCADVAQGEEGAVQYMDQRRFAAAIECDFVRLSRADQAADVVQKAFYLARTQSRPVMLSAPYDVQLQESDLADYRPSTEIIKIAKPLPDPVAVGQAAELIAESNRVVVLVGRGARAASADDDVLALQDRTGALLATTLQAKNWLCDRSDFHVGISGLYGGKVATELLQESDCVVAIGASLNGYTIQHGYLYPEARYIQIDNADHRVMGNGAAADCYIQSDARTGTAAIVQALGERGVKLTGYHTEENRNRLAAPTVSPADFRSEPGSLDPREVITVLDREIPSEIGLVLGSGHQTDFGTMLFQRSRDVLSNYGMFGAIGQAPLITIGSMIADQNRPRFVVEGDASFLMHLSEFETACRYQVPVLVVVLNDQALGAEYQKAKAKGLKPELAVINNPDLGPVAQSLGGGGATVRTIDELRAALADYVRNPRPTVIDVRISREVLSVPYARLWYGEDV